TESLCVHGDAHALQHRDGWTELRGDLRLGLRARGAHLRGHSVLVPDLRADASERRARIALLQGVELLVSIVLLSVRQQTQHGSEGRQVVGPSPRWTFGGPWRRIAPPVVQAGRGREIPRAERAVPRVQPCHARAGGWRRPYQRRGGRGQRYGWCWRWR